MDCSVTNLIRCSGVQRDPDVNLQRHHRSRLKSREGGKKIKQDSKSSRVSTAYRRRLGSRWDYNLAPITRFFPYETSNFKFDLRHSSQRAPALKKLNPKCASRRAQGPGGGPLSRSLPGSDSLPHGFYAFCNRDAGGRDDSQPSSGSPFGLPGPP